MRTHHGLVLIGDVWVHPESYATVETDRWEGDGRILGSKVTLRTGRVLFCDDPVEDIVEAFTGSRPEASIVP